jgi:hypothetical protein
MGSKSFLVMRNGDRREHGAGKDYRSRPASWATFCTGDRRYSSTVRVRLIGKPPDASRQ